MKAILVIDEMPKTCEECRLRNYNQCYGLEFDRTILEKLDGTNEFKTRNKICPLIEINDNIAKLIEVAR